MSKLQTPIGQLSIYFDGIKIDKKEWQKLSNSNKHVPEVDGRYCFKYEYKKDSRKHSLKCVFESPVAKSEIEEECGENYVALTFSFGELKLAIGAREINYERLQNEPDYKITVLPDGLEYNIDSDTESQTFIFCVAWVIKNVEEESRVWFAADPCYLEE